MDPGRLLRPRSVALVGGRAAAAAARQLRRLGFPGAVWPVNPGRARVEGFAAFPGLGALPGVPDAAFVGVNAEATVRAVAELAALGCGGAVCFASGFAEADRPELQERLVGAAAGMPLLGPNCHGFVNAFDRAALFPDAQGLEPVARGVAILSQSGNVGLNLTMQRRSLPIGLLVTLGNQAVLDAGALLAAAAADPRVSAVGLHLEGVRDVAGFARAVAAARARRVPVVALKAGRSRGGETAAFSHTGAMVGDGELWDALLARLGVARVDTPSELVETLKLLHAGGPLAGSRLASLSCSGGEAAMVADLAEPAGLALPELPAGTAAALREVLGPGVRVANPLDYHTGIWGDRAALTRCFAAALGAGFDLTALVLDRPTFPDADPAGWDAALDSLVAARAQAGGGRAAVIATLPEGLPEDRRQRLLAAGMAPLQGIGEAIRAVAAAARIGEAWRRPPPAALLAASAPSAEPLRLGESASRGLLARAGVAAAEAEEADAAAAPGVADRLGYPVVLKTTAAGHKSDAGGVALGLRSPGQVARAAERLGGPRVLVQRMVEGAVAELLLAVARRPPFGWALTLGAGGVLAELLDDKATLLLPTTEAEVRAALGRLKVARLLAGWRGGPAADLDAVVAAALGLARLAEAEPGLVELEVNPLLALPSGVRAVDARARTVPT